LTGFGSKPGLRDEMLEINDHSLARGCNTSICNMLIFFSKDLFNPHPPQIV